MARTSINFEIKKQEILSSIWDILLQYGYEEMTLTVIIRELGISRGAFYHYFTSKEDCVDASIKQYIENAVTELKVLDTPELSADIRFENAIKNAITLLHQNTKQDKIINQPENSVFHQKLMTGLTKYLSPYLAEIIDHGVATQIFDTVSTLETAEMLLTLSNFYLDKELFQWNTQDLPKKIKAFEELTNKVLGMKEYHYFFAEYMGESNE